MPTYPWGNQAASCAYAVMSEFTIFGVNVGCGTDSTWAVGSRPAGNSPYGISDMAGNVHEWVSDWYAGIEDESPRGVAWIGSP
jgi:iron(II)-dependent oxidoreductase